MGPYDQARDGDRVRWVGTGAEPGPRHGPGLAQDRDRAWPGTGPGPSSGQRGEGPGMAWRGTGPRPGLGRGPGLAGVRDRAWPGTGLGPRQGQDPSANALT